MAYLGIGRSCSFLQRHRDKKITLRFDGVASKADVYLNGKLLKTHLGAYTAFGVDITDICEVGKENLLAVKVVIVLLWGNPSTGFRRFFYFWGYLSQGVLAMDGKSAFCDRTLCSCSSKDTNP